MQTKTEKILKTLRALEKASKEVNMLKDEYPSLSEIYDYLHRCVSDIDKMTYKITSEML